MMSPSASHSGQLRERARVHDDAAAGGCRSRRRRRCRRYHRRWCRQRPAGIVVTWAAIRCAAHARRACASRHTPLFAPAAVRQRVPGTRPGQQLTARARPGAAQCRQGRGAETASRPPAAARDAVPRTRVCPPAAACRTTTPVTRARTRPGQQLRPPAHPVAALCRQERGAGTASRPPAAAHPSVPASRCLPHHHAGHACQDATRAAAQAPGPP